MVFMLDYISALESKSKTQWYLFAPISHSQHFQGALLAVTLGSHAAGLTPPLPLVLGSPQGRARRGPCHLAHAARGVQAARCLLFCGERLPGHTDALSNTEAVILHLVNRSSSRDFQQWNIIVCHMSVRNWLTGQTGCWDIPAFDYRSALWSLFCLSPSTSLGFHFCLTTFDFLIGLSQWPSDLVLHYNQFFPPKCIPACMRLSLSGGCITPKLLVNVFLITCFYWKPQFPVLPPHLWVWPDWAPTSVHRAKRHPCPPRRSIITTPAWVYGQPLSR